MTKEKFSISQLTNTDGCFDLQFRKDTRHERTNSPTYYRWKAQFIITLPKSEIKTLEKVSKELACGSVSATGNQARFSVQKIDDVVDIVIPYFTKHKLVDNKKKDFELWKKAADIIYRNKGIYMSKWSKNDLSHLMEIHKSSAKYKQKPRKGKWMEMAEVLTKKDRS